MSGLAIVPRTADQRSASDPGLPAWVSASAGSGKTSVLVDRVLRLLLAGTRPRHILCLTFTKAAAAEMSNRLALKLGAWAVAPDEALAADIEALGGATPSADTLALARQLFARVLDEPGGVRIQTIHAFCESVLKRFPLEAQVPPHFQVLDERDARELLADAQNAVFEHARRGGDAQAEVLSASIASLAEHMSETGFDELMGAMAGDRGRLARAVHAAGGLDGAVRAVYGALGLAHSDTEDDVLAAACADAALDLPGLRGAAEALLASGSDNDRKKGMIVADWLADPGGRAAGFEAYLKAFFTEKGKGTPLKTPATKAALAAMPDGGDALVREAARLEAARDRLRRIRIAATTSALLVLGDAVIERYEARKRAEARLDYDDLILHTRALLSVAQMTPWVLFKLDGGLDHVLIDEAQDTSPEQWSVVRALTEEFFTAGGAQDGPRTVFAVGDTKQSIFSFQGARPAEFEISRAHFETHAKNTGVGWRNVDLDTSFRSTEAVLGLVDAVFADPAARDGLLFDGGEIRHTASREREPGLVELWPPVPAEAPDEAAPWSVPEVEEGPPLARSRLARHVAETIRGWIERGERLEARGRPIRAGDIMVLVRRRGPFVAELVRHLKTLEVEVAGVDRMVVTEQLAVMDLIALGRFLLQPEDDLTLATVLRGPLAGLSEDDLFDLAWNRKGARLWRRLGDKAGEPRYASAHAFLAAMLAAADYVPPYELYARVLGPQGGRRKLVGRLGVDAHDPIDEFLSLALRYGQDHPPSLEGFLHWVEAAATEVKRDLEQSGRDQVRVMTVHGAKGLEAPVVILPDTLQKPTGVPAVLWSDDETEPPLWKPLKEDEEPVTALRRAQAEAERDREYRRLLYVALTRAADRLYVCGWHTRKTPPEGTWYEFVEHAMRELGEPFAFDGPWGGKGLRLVRGDRPGEPRPEAPERPAAAPLPDWARRAPPAEPTPPRPLAPSRPEGEDPSVRSPLAPDDPLRFLRGRLVHRLLQTLPELPAEARADAARRFLAQPVHGLDEAARDAVARETLAVLDDPAFAPLFGPGSMAEVPLAGVLGGRAISGQVDRLVVTAESVLVADYKTNRPPPATPAEVAPAYLRQMAVYRALLQRIYPGRTVDCALVWTDGPRLMRLDPAMLEPEPS